MVKFLALKSVAPITGLQGDVEKYLSQNCGDGIRDEFGMSSREYIMAEVMTAGTLRDRMAALFNFSPVFAVKADGKVVSNFNKQSIELLAALPPNGLLLDDLETSELLHFISDINLFYPTRWGFRDVSVDTRTIGNETVEVWTIDW